jgi:hypothetical protein
MASSTTNLSIAQLSLYALFAPLILFCLVKHGKHGLFGWLFLLIFSGLRITTSVLTIRDRSFHSGTAGASIINSIGLSPLLLADFGMLHQT